ncbi:MAG: DUF2130 domain-containing protein [Bacteroidota bacterium]|nr:DUF2130 domain-containing protein [Bacteroidota bacterium]MDP4215465.1 DUF2130 domain-containing protein [Bacteroidota bacterium]MDP4247035.1 DUF2130 domain-containing protein [Bacteroidota bacterium]MDP4255270.1 DUF2130 domain-containing protein [Bacteroidota bacterium]MDP4257491.1 DUF2130 domain-containing protein [Bacteroidota bacterium]
MATEIKCPNCGHLFPMEEAVSEEYKRELREQMLEYKKEKDRELSRRMDEERQRIQLSLEQSLRKSIGGDFENKVRLLEEANRDNEERLKASRQKELEFLRKEQELRTREAELELSLQVRLQEERGRLSAEIRKLEEQRTMGKETEYQMKVRELEKQLADQKKLAEDQRQIAEEMKRKAEQGSMQLQGEVQELALEELLRANFPFDKVSEVGKGVRGADCILTVRNNFGQECGKIIYESKRTRDFSLDWIDKLKADMRSQGALVAVIVTQAMPRDMECFGEKNGVWICSFSEVSALTHVLRDMIVRLFTAARSHDNKGDKMTLLYDYLTSSEFNEQWKAIREGFLSMRQSIQRERDTMEKLWKAREKQLEKVLLNAAHFRGSIEGIAGKDIIDVNLLDDGEGPLIDD